MASLLPSRLDFHVWTSKPAQLMKVKKTMTQVAKQGEERAKKQGIDGVSVNMCIPPSLCY